MKRQESKQAGKQASRQAAPCNGPLSRQVAVPGTATAANGERTKPLFGWGPSKKSVRLSVRPSIHPSACPPARRLPRALYCQTSCSLASTVASRSAPFVCCLLPNERTNERTSLDRSVYRERICVRYFETNTNSRSQFFLFLFPAKRRFSSRFPTKLVFEPQSAFSETDCVNLFI